MAASIAQQVEQTAQGLDDKANHRAEHLAQPFEKAFYMHCVILVSTHSLAKHKGLCR
ncbi:hypothetical protein D9M73_269970 [compost metagenome]